MVIQHNMTAANANRNLGVTTGQLAKSTEKLSSGYKINRAGDNAAGLAISEKMRGQIRGLDQASTNAEDGISMIQTAEGALTETHSILQRMRELAVQASSDTNTDDDRTQIQNEIDQLTQEVDRIATTTEFNTKKLIDGSAKGAVSEKAGKANVDATFANSNVSAAITKDGSAKAAFTDVIRVEITADFAAGKSTDGTKKLDDATITKIHGLVTATTDQEFGSATGRVTIGNTGYSADKSTEENIAAALSEAQTVADTKESAATDSSRAVKLNEKAIDKLAGNLLNAKATTAAGDVSLMKEGVTKSQIKDALTAYVSALQDAGTSNSNKANGSSTAITKAKDDLEALFSKDATATTAAKNNAGLLVGTDYKLDTLADKGTDFDFSAATSSTVTAQATALAGKVEEVAQEIAATAIKNDQNQEDVAKAKDVVKTLSDTDLVKAAVEFKTAEANKTTVDSNANSTDAAKEEAADKLKVAQAALDKLNTSEAVLNVTDLFGNTDDTKKFEIGSKVDDDNNLTITLKNKEGDDTVITISNADKMKAGDVITITAKEMVETEQAPTGKDAFRLQVGANAGQEVMLGINSMKAKDLNIVQTKEGVEGKALDVTNQASASLAVNAYDMAIQSVSTERAKLGATQNRLEHTISNLDTSSENLQAAESSLRDTDMAEEMTKYSKNNILMQAGQSMLAQANQATQGVLSLLG